MVRHTDMKMIALKEEVYAHRLPRIRRQGTEPHAMQGHVGKCQGQSRGRGSEGKIWARVFIVVSSEGMVRLGKQA